MGRHKKEFSMLEEILDLIDKISKITEYVDIGAEEVKQYNLQDEDLEHFIEKEDDNKKCGELGIQLRELRRKRRKVKINQQLSYDFKSNIRLLYDKKNQELLKKQLQEREKAMQNEYKTRANYNVE